MTYSIRLNREFAQTLIDQAEAAKTPTVEIQFDLDSLLAEHGLIADIWSVGDVSDVRPDLTRDQAMAVLQQVIRRHDANNGINWDVLSDAADSLFPDEEP